MTNRPMNLKTALASFDQVYSPRIVARVDDYEVRVAHVKGDHVWHVHDDTDEFFLVLDGSFDVSIRHDDGGTETVRLGEGDLFVVPRGVEHRPSSVGGAVLIFERAGTLTTGDRLLEEIPDHITTSSAVPVSGL
jgi:mannose-6-phosphate isomerase-like protein (cupin superfamily)